MAKIITEQMVIEAAQKSKKIFLEKGTIITPAARDKAKELNVQFENKVNQKIEAEIRQLDNRSMPLIVVGADHGGYYLKEELKSFLQEQHYPILDVGTHSPDACDYPDFAFKVGKTVASGKAAFGIMIDSVGIGSAMAANRVKGVLAAKCNNTVEAQSAREHNYANVLTLGAKIIGSQMARQIVITFLTTKGGAERHQRRVKKILDYKDE